MLLNVFISFFSIFFCFFWFFVFHHKICVLIMFISFFDEATNFRNRILTNQNNELMPPNCQWNCMFPSIFMVFFSVNYAFFWTSGKLDISISASALGLQKLCFCLKGALSGLRQFPATENPL